MEVLFEKYNINEFKDKKIINKFELSNSFGMKCERIVFEDHSSIVLKYYENKIDDFNAIISEANSLSYLRSRFQNLFPKVHFVNEKLLVMDYISHNGIKGDDFQKQLAFHVTKIHNIKNNQFGFEYDTPIGGLKQPSNFSSNWIDFYREKRLGMIFELINNSNPMPNEINIGLEKILNNVENLLPNNPEPSLIHGDLWEGNILFNNKKLVGLIDPGVHFAHNEMELAYLIFFNYVNEEFFDNYSNTIKIEKEFYKYQYVYQLYYALLNVHLWSRNYIDNVKELVKKFN